MIQRQFDDKSVVEDREAIEEAVAEFYEYEDALIEARRSNPGDDLIPALIQPENEGDRLSHNELRNLVLNILVGGVDTSQSQLAHAVRLLAEHPDQWEALRQDPQGLALAAVDEAVRYEPIPPSTPRLTVHQLEYRGITFPPNTLLLASPFHANRDGIGHGRFDILADRAAPSGPTCP